MFYTNLTDQMKSGISLIFYLSILIINLPALSIGQTHSLNETDSLNLEATVDCDDVLLNWDEPGTALSKTDATEETQYNVYRGDSILNEEPFQETSFLDRNVPVDNYTYYLEVTTRKHDKQDFADSTDVEIEQYFGQIDLETGNNGLSWELQGEENADLMGYNVYRDGILIEDNFQQNYIIWFDPPEHPHECCVEAEFQSGCLSQMDCDSVKISTSIEQVAEQVVKIVSNPARNKLNIKSLLKIASISGYDLKGTKVFHRTVNQRNFTIQLSKLSPGIYFLHLLTEDGISEAKKLVVK